VLTDYDLTVVADPSLPDEYVLVPPEHPAAQELTAGGAEPCGVEVAEAGRLPVVLFGVNTRMHTLRLAYWWADWQRVAREQRLRERDM
jgi:hypothetical protein